MSAGFASSGAWLLGCGDEPAPAADPSCDRFAQGELVSVVPFVGEGDVPLETLVGQGWDGRLYTDLSKLSSDSLLIESARFYVRTFYPDLLDPSLPWAISVSGLVGSPRTLSLADLDARVEAMGVHLLECSGNGSGGHFGLLSAADWAGVPLTALLSSLQPLSAATRVLISGFDQHSVPSANGHSTPGASWIFSFAELEQAGAFLATEMNGEPLPEHHGAPVRLFVPNWYGCCAIKWVNEIVFVDEAALATAQMQEFAGRTHQVGVPTLARDYRPATLDQAAMPVRIEKWRENSALSYRVIGILWGGYQPTNALEIRFGDSAWQPVDVCPAHAHNDPWTLWEHRWQPPAPGNYKIALRVADPNVPQRRLDSGWYVREVDADEV